MTGVLVWSLLSCLVLCYLALALATHPLLLRFVGHVCTAVLSLHEYCQGLLELTTCSFSPSICFQFPSRHLGTFPFLQVCILSLSQPAGQQHVLTLGASLEQHSHYGSSRSLAPATDMFSAVRKQTQFIFSPSRSPPTNAASSPRHHSSQSCRLPQSPSQAAMSLPASRPRSTVDACPRRRNAMLRLASAAVRATDED